MSLETYTGRELELDCLGEFEQSPAAKKALQRIQKGKGYVKYREAIDWIERHYKDDPTEPRQRWARDLHTLVAEALGLQDYEDLKFYTTVRTPLDRYHGVDGFFRFKGKVVTVDVTKNPDKKARGHKADAILLEPETEPEDKKERQRAYEDRLKEHADDIIQFLT